MVACLRLLRRPWPRLRARPARATTNGLTMPRGDPGRARRFTHGHCIEAVPAAARRIERKGAGGLVISGEASADENRRAGLRRSSLEPLESTWTPGRSRCTGIGK